MLRRSVDSPESAGSGLVHGQNLDRIAPIMATRGDRFSLSTPTADVPAGRRPEVREGCIAFKYLTVRSTIGDPGRREENARARGGL